MEDIGEYLYYSLCSFFPAMKPWRLLSDHEKNVYHIIEKQVLNKWAKVEEERRAQTLRP